MARSGKALITAGLAVALAASGPVARATRDPEPPDISPFAARGPKVKDWEQSKYRKPKRKKR